MRKARSEREREKRKETKESKDADDGIRACVRGYRDEVKTLMESEEDGE